MTELLQELTRELEKLPAEKQERWISHFLEELSSPEADKATKLKFSREWIGGRRPTQEEVSEAIKRMEELSKGIILGDDITLKDLINEGRRY